jgi:hypothetical protein
MVHVYSIVSYQTWNINLLKMKMVDYEHKEYSVN